MMLKQKRAQRNGFVLVVVLCMVIMLAVMLFGFNTKSRMNLRAADDFRKSEQALNCARAGLNITIAAIRNTDDISKNNILRSFLTKENSFDVADGTCSITIVEESGKLNVNLLKDKNGKLNRTRTDQVLRLIDLLNQESYGDSTISYDIVPSIIDWTDNDSQSTCLPFIKNKNLGAESSYYDQLKIPYACRNRPFDTMQELLLVKDVTTQVFNQIRDYVTVYGDGKININYASKHVINSLSEKMDAALAQLIIDQRKLKPFDDITELIDILGMTDDVYYTIKNTATVGTTNQYYHITSRGTVDDLDCMIIAVLRKNVKTKNIEVVIYKEC